MLIVSQAFVTKWVKKCSAFYAGKLCDRPQIAGTNWRFFFHVSKKLNLNGRCISLVKIRCMRCRDGLMIRMLWRGLFSQHFSNVLVHDGRVDDILCVTYIQSRYIYAFKWRFFKYYIRSFCSVKYSPNYVYHIHKLYSMVCMILPAAAYVAKKVKICI